LGPAILRGLCSSGQKVRASCEQSRTEFPNRFINALKWHPFDDIYKGLFAGKSFSNRPDVKRGDLFFGGNMPLPTVVIAQRDQSISQWLANELDTHFSRVLVADNVAELHTLLLRHQARVAVLDADILSLEEIGQLANSFGDLAIVATHHSPDERMWMEALEAGAAEFCHPRDIGSILRASR